MTHGVLTAQGGRPIRRASITNLGCKVNQAEMDAVARLLRGRGVQLVDDGAPVELHVVSDATGETAARLVTALEAQFPDQALVELPHPPHESADDRPPAVHPLTEPPSVVL